MSGTLLEGPKLNESLLGCLQCRVGYRVTPEEEARRCSCGATQNFPKHVFVE